MAAKLISPTFPSIRGEIYLAQALASVFSQRYRPIEVIVVDDGSPDDTESIARSFPGVRYIYQENQGHGVAKNTGVAQCTGDLITFLDADDLWAKDSLDVQSEYLATHPETGGVMGRVWNFLEEKTTMPSWISEDMLTEEGGGWNLGASLTHRWVLTRSVASIPISGMAMIWTGLFDCATPEFQ